MAKLVEVVAKSDFWAGGELIEEGESVGLSESDSKTLVGTGQAAYPVEEASDSEDGEGSDSEEEESDESETD
ncbi:MULTISPECIES: hypothetical protein [unclassified Neptuniibacter]|uniref:hypothetical protein n=1 Tax=unclassified Neptuniibacter TaxID=2630693 RepID=UPI000C4CB971|nr:MULTISPECIES: hypothetical protein [unclassified Neptuniibacter]MAY42389.1 hypothetical protein [Oceanospirillaceae bacterium]|tara:strand:- start:13613 stop:13828 length:216 start_codon:yes stop_codon:yes gene_type:complete